jgi:hypothetical protein
MPRDGAEPSAAGRILQLAFLASDIVDAILAGRQSIDLTAKRLKPGYRSRRATGLELKMQKKSIHVDRPGLTKATARPHSR